MVTATCSSCGHGNPAASRFCLQCGAAFAMLCSSCATALPPGARFCNRCGAGAPASRAGLPTSKPDPQSYTPKHLADKILRSKSALEGERKQVTVLFADVKSSMEIAEQLDPEDWHKIMDRFFAILTEGVHRFEGTVNQYTGDGIMALFGAPIAHEDHAQRACYAALHMQDALREYADRLRLESGLNFAVRIGLNSGEVVVGSIGDDLRMDYTAQGHVVGLAARMEQIAAPGTTYLTEHTARVAGDYLRLRDLGESKVKGVSQRLRVYELLGAGSVRTRFDVSRARGLSRFVGRSAELQLLEEALEATLGGEGRAVGIVAQAGVGKSRLCYEFVQRCRARGVRVFQAQSVSHEKSVPLLPALDLMRGYFGINEDDDESTARDKVAGRVVLLDPSLAAGLPVLFDFLGIPDPGQPPGADTAARQHHLADILERVARARSEREAVVFLLEDLHWIDDASAVLVKQILDRVPRTRTLLIVNFRPELQADWLAVPHFRRMALQPLTAEVLGELLADVTGSHPSLAALPAWILERSGGNPFYVEELVRELIEDGTLAGTRGAYQLARPLDDAAVPPTIHAILAARIDRLPVEQKDALQAAAVVGRSFARSVLAVVLAGDHAGSIDDLDATLAALVAGEFLYEESQYPERLYAFKHALTQEVAYGSQLSDRRKRLHASTAQALEHGPIDKLDERAGAIARHWESAGKPLAAARWYCRGAEWLGFRQLGDAATHWDKVLSLCSKLPDSDEAAQIELAGCIGVLNSGFRTGIAADRAEQVYQRGRQLAQRCADPELAKLLESTNKRVLFSTGKLPIVDRATAEGVEDPETRVTLALDTVLGDMATGKLRQAFAQAAETIAYIDSQPQLLRTMAGAGVMGFSGLLATMLGRPQDAAVPIERAMEAAREMGFIEVVGWCYGWRASMHSMRGEPDAAIADGRRAMRAAEQLDSTFSVATATMGLVGALLLHGDWQEARTTCENSLEQIKAHGAGLGFRSQILLYLAEARLQLGDLEGAGEVVEQAVTEATERRNLVALSRALITRAEVRMEQAGLEACAAIEADLADAERLIAETGATIHQPFLHHARARFAEAAGDSATADRERLREIELWRAQGADSYAARVETERHAVAKPHA